VRADRPPWRWLQWLVAALCAIVAFYIYVPVIADWSTDFGWHYILVRYIGETWWLPPVTHTWLGPMVDYPPGAHVLAAVLSAFLPQTIAMNLVVIAAIYLTYLFAALIVPAPHRLMAIVVAVVLIVVMRQQRINMITGFEVRENSFFFAQIVGDAAFVGSMWLIGRLDPFKPAVVALAVIAAFGIGSIYNLSAVKFLGSFAALHAIYVLLSRPEWRRRFAISTAAITCVAIATFLHPLFMGMVANAAHDGGIRVQPRMAVSGACALLTVSLALFWLEHRSRGIRVLVAMGFGVSLAALAQYAALRLFGFGSNYAVSKHGYLIGVLLAIGIGTLIASLLERVRPVARATWVDRRMLAATFAICGCILALGKPGLSLGPFTAYRPASES
jgi:hypothetical protein